MVIQFVATRPNGVAIFGCAPDAQLGCRETGPYPGYGRYKI
jgi:hypothetical protein